MAVGTTRRQELAAKVLPSEEWGKYLNQSSDAAGFQQLGFHLAWVALGASIIHFSLQAGCTLGFVAGECLLGFVSSFYFMGFHEFIHNTAFATKWINRAIGYPVGFLIFRGMNWFWCFHWLHHRYTQDPEKDPELSGGSSDLTDPSKSVLMYARFLTGWPFGFERALNMCKLAVGLKSHDPFVVEAGMEDTVRKEAAVYALGYVAFAAGAILDENVRSFVLYYWLLPHILGAGHLRFYQFAEHRACETGNYTDLDAWGATRTTSTWWLYSRLAWNMPYHIEHHAWPAVPFHLLPEVHERIKDNQPESRCLIPGNNGYFAIHLDFLRRVIAGKPTAVTAAPQPKVEKTADAEKGETEPAAAKNRLGDAEAMAKLPVMTLEEVAKHNTKSDCWVAVNGLVADVSSFLNDHPGGETILVTQAGKDVSKMFKMIHPERTLENWLPDRCIVGVLADTAGAGGLKEPLLK